MRPDGKVIQAVGLGFALVGTVAVVLGARTRVHEASGRLAVALEMVAVAESLDSAATTLHAAASDLPARLLPGATAAESWSSLTAVLKSQADRAGASVSAISPLDDSVVAGRLVQRGAQVRVSGSMAQITDLIRSLELDTIAMAITAFSVRIEDHTPDRTLPTRVEAEFWLVAWSVGAHPSTRIGKRSTRRRGS